MVHVSYSILFQTRVAYHVLHSYILFVISKKNTGHTDIQEKERHKKVEINKLNNNNKKLKKRKNQSCADFHDESITFLQGNISQYTRKLYEMKSSLSEGYKIERGL